MNVTSPDFTLAAAAFVAVLHHSVAHAATRTQPAWPQRLLVSAGATMAVAALAFMLVLWGFVVTGQGGNRLGATLLALILSVASAMTAGTACLLAARTGDGSRAIVRWSIPLGYAAAVATSAYAFVHGW